MNQNTNLTDQILFKPSSIVRILGISAAFLILVSVAGQVITYVFGYDYIYNRHYVYVLIKLTYVDLEQNFPTFFSSFILLFASVLLFFITVMERKRKSSSVLKWGFLSLIFLGLSMDEFISLHERMIVPMRNMLGNSNLGIFFYAWIIPGLLFVLVLAIFMLRFFFKLNVKTRVTFLIAAILYIGGAIGLEAIDGYYAELHGEQNLIYGLMSNIEEAMEMSGTIVFIWGLLVYISDNFKAVKFQFANIEENLLSDGKK